MFVIPWKFHLVFHTKIGIPTMDIVVLQSGVLLTLSWKGWWKSHHLQITFKDTGVEWDDPRDATIRYSYGYEKMGSFNGDPILIVDKNYHVNKHIDDWTNYEIHVVELFSYEKYEQMITQDLSKIPEIKEDL